MKPAYTIIIIGTGQHHQGHSTGNPERDADHQLKALVDRLQATGQNITAAAFIVDDKPEMIIGKPEDLSFDTDAAGAVTLQLLNEKIDRLEAGQNGLSNLTRLMNEVLTADKQPAQESKPVRGSKKKGGGAEEKTKEEEPLVIEEAQPLAVIGSGGRIAMAQETQALPGSTGAAEGDNQVQQGTTTAEGAGDEGTTTKTTGNEEQGEG